MPASKMKQQAKRNKEKACKMIEQYIRDAKEMNTDAVIDSGQLKFLTDELMMRHLVLTTTVKVNSGLSRMKAGLGDTIFASDEVAAGAFDCEKNIMAFCNSKENWGGLSLEQFQVIEGFPWYILLQKAQNEMECAFVDFLHNLERKPKPKKTEGEDSEACKQEEEVIEGKIYKEEMYYNFVRNTALYEIFILEYYNEVCENCIKNLDKARILEVAEELEHLLKVFQEENLDSEKITQFKGELPKLQEKMKSYKMEWDKVHVSLMYVLYFFSHMRNLYAMLRVIMEIEFINFNYRDDTINGEDAKHACWIADNLFDSYAEYENALFLLGERKSHLGKFYKSYNELYVTCFEKNQKEQREYLQKYTRKQTTDLITQYIDLIEEKVGDKSFSTEKERELVKMENILAGIMGGAEDGVMEIQQKA